MPGSPKIWGTLELKKQADRLQGHLRASAHPHPDPREARRQRAAQERHPAEPGSSLPWGNQPVNTSH